MRTRRILSVALLLMVLLCQTALATILPSSEDFVTDQAGVLQYETEGYLSLNAKALNEACGAEIVYITVRTTGNKTMEDYAYETFNKWQIGGARDNGVLVLMAIDDDDYYTLQGTGLEDSLSSGELSVMQNDYLEPDFARKDYDRGAMAFYDQIHKRLCAIENVNVPLISMNEVEDYIKGTGESQGQQGAVNQGVSGGNVRKDEGGGEIMWAIIIVLLILFLTRRPRRNVGSGYGGGWGGGYSRPRSGGNFWLGYLLGRGNNNNNRRPPFGGGGFGGSSGGGFGGSNRSGGSSFGGGRSSGGSSFGGGRSGGSRPSGGIGGGRSGGGSSRGGGAGRGR